MSKLHEKLEKDVRVDASTLVLKKSIKKWITAAKSKYGNKLCVNFSQRIIRDLKEYTAWIDSQAYSPGRLLMIDSLSSEAIYKSLIHPNSAADFPDI